MHTVNDVGLSKEERKLKRKSLMQIECFQRLKQAISIQILLGNECGKLKTCYISNIHISDLNIYRH